MKQQQSSTTAEGADLKRLYFSGANARRRLPEGAAIVSARVQ